MSIDVRLRQGNTYTDLCQVSYEQQSELKENVEIGSVSECVAKAFSMVTR